VFANISTLGDGLLFGNPAVPVEVAQSPTIGFSDDRVVYQYVDRPRLLAAHPGIVNPALIGLDPGPTTSGQAQQP
jgi:hypothetical protein